MPSVFTASLAAVARILFAAGVGAWLARRGVLNAQARTVLSRIILFPLLPCLLFSKLSRAASIQNLASWVALPLSAAIYIAAGFAVGRLLTRTFLQDPDERRVFTAASAFGNSGYIPIPLAAALAATSPLFKADPGAAARGIAYISVYLVVMSPCLWGIGYPYLSGRPMRDLSIRQVLSPPVLAALAGILFGVVPGLRAAVAAADAPLQIIEAVAEMLGAGAIPCSLLVMGANIAGDPGPADESHGGGPRDGYAHIVLLTITRLVILPLIGVCVTTAAAALGLLPPDPMFMMVMLLESCVPPATNLIVMCQLHGRGERRMARAQFWTYVAAAPMLTVNAAVFLWIVRNCTAVPSV